MSHFIHPTSILDDDVIIGDGTRIWHWVHVSSGARIGQGCSLGQNVFVGKGVSIGNNVKIQNNVSIYERVILEDDVFCGPSMVFTNVTNPRSHVERKHEYKETLVKRGASLGANCTILCGYQIGEYAMIGASSVVTRDVPDYAVIVGNPGRRIGWVCRCGVRLPAKENSQCEACGSGYRIETNACSRIT